MFWDGNLCESDLSDLIRIHITYNQAVSSSLSSIFFGAAAARWWHWLGKWTYPLGRSAWKWVTDTIEWRLRWQSNRIDKSHYYLSYILHGCLDGGAPFGPNKACHFASKHVKNIAHSRATKNGHSNSWAAKQLNDGEAINSFLFPKMQFRPLARDKHLLPPAISKYQTQYLWKSPDLSAAEWYLNDAVFLYWKSNSRFYNEIFNNRNSGCFLLDELHRCFWKTTDSQMSVDLKMLYSTGAGDQALRNSQWDAERHTVWRDRSTRYVRRAMDKLIVRPRDRRNEWISEWIETGKCSSHWKDW